MVQKLIPLALCGIVLLIGRRYYKAVRHELYQVWDSMNDIEKKLGCVAMEVVRLKQPESEEEDDSK